MAAKKTKKPTSVESVEHQDKRVNIPTDRQTHLVAEGETVELRYPRDPSLDPQLIWKGKDELDGDDLKVPSLPIYIQEKIDPRVLVENLRATAKEGELEPELTLFDDFDGTDELDAMERIEFYQHEGNWQNRMILGDSLVVMASLAERENLRGKVQMIYIDPPYGIKFGSNWQVSTRKTRVADGRTQDVTREPETIKAFRDTWKLGIHSYLSYMRDRLSAARDLLTGTGCVFVQIGDENLHLVRNLLDEIFGSENFVSIAAVKKTTGGAFTYLPGNLDFVLLYARDATQMKYRQLFSTKQWDSSAASRYNRLLLPDGTSRPLLPEEVADEESVPEGSRRFRHDNLTSSRPAQGSDIQEFEFEGSIYSPGSGTFKTDGDGLRRLAEARRIEKTGRSISYVRFLDDFPAQQVTNLWDDISGAEQSRSVGKMYVVQTSTRLVERCILMSTDPGDLVLDPTCGSGTTAYVAEQWGRRWITVDTSRVALALARTRLMSAQFPYYLLADSSEGRAKEGEIGWSESASQVSGGDIRKGFAYQRVSHITLKSIANNPDILPDMSRSEIDAAVERHSDSELLYDLPFVDRRKIRVAGRFTVESLSPHRMLDVDDSRDRSQGAEDLQFETMILDNLRKAGVQNTYKDERLNFDRLEPLSGEWLQAEGEYTEKDGTIRRVALSIGPEHGTVGSDQVALAAQEATRGIPYDLLLVTGFAFDPNAWATAKEIDSDTAERKVGRLQILLVRANADLSMGDELLKKTGAGNLFVVFGEPDIDITNAEGQITVEIKGLDVYDPTTGQVRSSSTDDLAAWFIDTNYDGTSFFVRHAYFTGGQRPYEALAKTLKSAIDAEEWATIYSTVSRPFDPPETGKIAVKIINHYGDEVLQVYEVATKKSAAKKPGK